MGIDHIPGIPSLNINTQCMRYIQDPRTAAFFLHLFGTVLGSFPQYHSHLDFELSELFRFRGQANLTVADKCF